MELSFEFFSGPIALALFVVTLPGTVELALLSIGAVLPARRRIPAALPSGRDPRLCVIIPVYNEEIAVAQTIRSILACDNALPPTDLIVMACNSTDRSAEIARGFGCTVLERLDPTRRGKGYGLDYAFRHLADKNY